MEFFRNPEVKRTCIWYLVLTIVFPVIGGMIGKIGLDEQASRGKYQDILLFVGVIFLVCMVFDASYLFSTISRYRNIKKLSRQLDELLHTNKRISFSDYKEGELSILENELSKMTSRLLEQAEHLEQDKKYLSDAMADISHQLRSPLTSSQLILSLLKEPGIKEERRRELLQEQTQLLSHMGWLVESMLKMAKMDAKTAYLKQEPVKVKELLQKALEPVLIPMELRGIAYRQSGVTDDMSFLGDLSWCSEAVLNIVKNCMEHTAAGGLMEIRCQDMPLYLELVIEDNGSGICPEDLPYLFERFYKGQNAGEAGACEAVSCGGELSRMHGGRSIFPEGVGIGLALSRMIITAMNGTVKVENRREGGARFTIRFYRQKTV